MTKASKDKVDIIITWVDGGDEKWQKEKFKYSNNSSNDYDEWTNLIFATETGKH